MGTPNDSDTAQDLGGLPCLSSCYSYGATACAKEPMKHSGEPCDRKRSRTVRRGAFGKVPMGQLARRLPYAAYYSWLSEHLRDVLPAQLVVRLPTEAE